MSKNPSRWLLLIALLSLGAAPCRADNTPPAQQQPAADPVAALVQSLPHNIAYSYQFDRAKALNNPDFNNDKSKISAELAKIDAHYQALSDYLSKQPPDKVKAWDNQWANAKNPDIVLKGAAQDQLNSMSYDPKTQSFFIDKSKIGTDATSVAAGGVNGNGTPGAPFDSRMGGSGSSALQAGLKTKPVADVHGDGTQKNPDADKPFKLSDNAKQGLKWGIWGAIIGGILMGPAGFILFGLMAAGTGYFMAVQGSPPPAATPATPAKPAVDADQSSGDKKPDAKPAAASHGFWGGLFGHH